MGHVVTETNRQINSRGCLYARAPAVAPVNSRVASTLGRSEEISRVSTAARHLELVETTFDIISANSALDIKSSFYRVCR